MVAEFLLPRSEGRPLTVRLERDAVVGRGTAAGLRISSRRVSRSHCRVSVDGDVVRVRDLGSRNGTFVDGHGVGEEDLEVPLGGTLSIGGVTMKLVRAGDRTYRPDGAAMLAEVEEEESHHGEGPVQDSPSGVVVGLPPAEDLSDDSVSVLDESAERPADAPDRPSPPPAAAAVSEEEAADEDEPIVLADDEEFAAAEDGVESGGDAAADGDEDEPADDSGEFLSDDDGSDAELGVDDKFEESAEEPSAVTAAPAFGGEPAEAVDEDAAFDFLSDDADAGGEADSAALKVLPGGDAADQSSFAGFSDGDDEDVDSSLLGFLDDPK